MSETNIMLFFFVFVKTICKKSSTIYVIYCVYSCVNKHFVKKKKKRVWGGHRGY